MLYRDNTFFFSFFFFFFFFFRESVKDKTILFIYYMLQHLKKIMLISKNIQSMYVD